MFKAVVLRALPLLLLAACSKQPALAPLPSSTATASIDAARLMEHVKVLASDEFEGRLPATAGEAKTLDYLIGQFKAMGLAPGNPDGNYTQAVPLVGIDGTPAMKLTAGGKTIAMKMRSDFVATTTRVAPKLAIKDSPLVFVGYGVQAPEYNWDDYKGLDARGKTLVMLINDPQVPSAADPAALDDQLFKGLAMTYYGRWTYKYEMGTQLRADAVLIVHETEPAGYGWSVVEHSWSGEQFQMDAPDGNADKVAVQGWITLDKAKALFAASGQDFEALKAAAQRADFKPVVLNARVSVDISNQTRQVQSQNVVALVPGSDPALAGEYVLYSAHWDHLGRDAKLTGDQIYNGAVDNASGVAGLLEIARAFATGAPKPKRSVLFLAVTAEEQGLLGSAYYAANPLYPVNKTLADINMDSINVYGRTRDVQVIGFGQNSLEDNVAALLKSANRVLIADHEPQKGRYFRSDQFSFAKAGVPGLYLKAGVEVLGQPASYGQQKSDEYTEKHYHGVSDHIYDDWNLAGAAEDMQLLYHVGLDVANGSVWPTWRAGSEFRQTRESSLKLTSDTAQAAN